MMNSEENFENNSLASNPRDMSPFYDRYEKHFGEAGTATSEEVINEGADQPHHL
jgi:hypothetical protein